jgi:hemerythrin-like domain-containing protein
MITQPLREDHRELLKDVELLRVTADSLSEENLTAASMSGIETCIDFLIKTVIPHSLAEDRAIYPVLQKIMGSSHATESMSHDHMVISNLTRELCYVRGKITGLLATMDQILGLRRVLYGLHILIKTHIDKEEEHYIPLLEENLQPEEFTYMMESLQIAQAEVRKDIPMLMEGFKSS